MRLGEVCSVFGFTGKENPVKTACLEDRRALSPILSFKSGFSLGVPELASKTGMSSMGPSYSGYSSGVNEVALGAQLLFDRALKKGLVFIILILAAWSLCDSE